MFVGKSYVATYIFVFSVFQIFWLGIRAPRSTREVVAYVSTHNAILFRTVCVIAKKNNTKNHVLVLTRLSTKLTTLGNISRSAISLYYCLSSIMLTHTSTYELNQEHFHLYVIQKYSAYCADTLTYSRSSCDVNKRDDTSVIAVQSRE